MSEDTRTPVLSVEGLVVDYRTRSKDGGKKLLARAVDGVDLHVHAGETLAIVGESGSGKTSIANAVMRLIDVSGGRIMFQGTDLVPLRGKALRVMRPRLQMVFQDPFESLDPRLTVLDTVLEPLIINNIGGSAEERRAKAYVALENAGLTPPERIGKRFTHELSGGQRQRVAIAAAMILEPELVVADEPVSMLDVSLRAGILRLMADMRDRGVAYLFITHDLSLAWMFADRIAVVYLGRVVEEGSPVDLIGAPQHPYTRALVSVIPVPDSVQDADRTVLTGEIPNPTAIPSGCRFHPRCPKFRELGEPGRCTDEDPSLRALTDRPEGADGVPHRVACHFAD